MSIYTPHIYGYLGMGAISLLLIAADEAVPQTESRRCRRLKFANLDYVTVHEMVCLGLGRSVSLAQLSKNFQSQKHLLVLLKQNTM